MRRMRGQSEGDRWASDRAKARDMCVFTTHTPVEAGHDRFGYELVEQVTRDLVPIAELKELAGGDALNMTRLALNLCGSVNGVARRHATTTRDTFPGYSVDSVTNAAHRAEERGVGEECGSTCNYR